MMPITLGDETLALNVANIALGVVTLGVVVYFLAALSYGFLRRAGRTQTDRDPIPDRALGHERALPWRLRTQHDGSANAGIAAVSKGLQTVSRVTGLDRGALLEP